MPNFQIFKYLRITALALLILDFILTFVVFSSLGILNLIISVLFQTMVITYLNRYGNYLNEEDYSKIQSGEWRDIMDIKGYLFGVYCIIIGSAKVFRGVALLMIYINSLVFYNELDRFLYLFDSIITTLYGTIVIYYVIMTFILLKNQFPKGDDSQILDKDS